MRIAEFGMFLFFHCEIDLRQSLIRSMTVDLYPFLASLHLEAISSLNPSLAISLWSYLKED